MRGDATTDEQAQPGQTALIVEGGAMRGAWAAGVLEFLYERGMRQFDLVYAASSGACSAAYFVAGMVKPGLTIWREHVSGRKMVRKSNLLRRKPIIDLAYLIDYVFKEEVPLSVAAIRAAPTRFHIGLTDCHTGGPVYFPARDERIFDALRASSSMPFATLGFWYVDGKPYTDGGIADAIPVRRALEEGATDITVVLTHGASFRLTPRSRLMGRLAFPLFPAAVSAWANQHIQFNESMELLAHPPSGIRIRVFSPMKPMRVNGLTRNRTRLHEAVAAGREEAARQIQPPTTIITPATPD
jgi:predicted patatin/cPLA2 family phospholipase